MSLFQCCNKPIKFVFCRIDEKELEELKILVTANGGDVSFSDPFVQIKFTQIHNYLDYNWSGAKVYNVQFIRQCVEQSKIVDPEPYRLSPKLMHDECLMSHFLFGSCDCASLLKAQVTAETSDSVNTFFTPSTEFPEMTSDLSGTIGSIERHLNLSTDPSLSKNRHNRFPSTLSTSSNHQPIARSNISSSNDRHNNSSSGPIGTKDTAETVALSDDDVDPSVVTSPLDESQSVVKSLLVMDRQAIAMKMSIGDGDAASMIDGHEKNCCSSEYRRLVEPKLQMLDHRRKKHLRTPTTLDTGSDMPTVVFSEDPSGVLDGFTELSVSRESTSRESVGASKYSNVEKKATSPTVSDASTMIENYSPQTENARKRLNSPFPPIAMQNASNDNNPVAKYMRCKNGERGLVSNSLESNKLPPDESRSSKNSQKNSTGNCSTQEKSRNKVQNSSKLFNPFCKNNLRLCENPLKTISKPRVPIPSETDKSDDEVLISRAPFQYQEPSSSENDRKNDSDNEPGPSGSAGRHRTVTQADILSGASSSDEINSPIEKHKSLERIGKKNQKECKKIVACTGNCANVDRDDVIALLSSDDEDRTLTFTRRNPKITDNRVYKSINSINKQKRESTVSHKSINVKKASKNGNSDHRQNGKNSLNKHLASSKNPADLLSKLTKICSSEVRPAESGRVNAKSRNILNATRITDPLDRNYKSLAAKTKGRVTERTKKDVICRSRADIARQAELNAISVKLANNESRKLRTEAYMKDLLIQDSETDDEIDDDDDDYDNRTTSVQYKDRNKTTKKSLIGKEDDKRNRKRKLKEQSRNRNSSVDSDSSSYIFPEFPAKKTSKLKPPPKKVPNNRSTNRQRDEAFRSSSSSDDMLIKHEEPAEPYSGSRMLYTDSETNEMIKFLVRTQSIASAKGRKIFEAMSKDKKLRHRTATSLYNRFQKILPNIERLAASLKIHPDIIAEFTNLMRSRR